MSSPNDTTRIDLAACYRLIAMAGWDDLIFTHISARVPNSKDKFWLAPFDRLFEEVKSSDLVEISVDDPVTAHPQVNPAAITAHAAIMSARPEVNCVIHLHTPCGIAVSAQPQGLLPLSQQAVVLGKVAYHDYDGIVLKENEGKKLAKDLGNGKALVLRNHGTLTVGESVPEAFRNMYSLEMACQIQLMNQGTDNLITIPDDVAKLVASESLFRNKDLREKFWAGQLRKLDRRDPSYRD